MNILKDEDELNCGSFSKSLFKFVPSIEEVGDKEVGADVVVVVVETCEADDGVILFSTYFNLCKYKFRIFCHGNLFF
jgi:hypothetical protein